MIAGGVEYTNPARELPEGARSVTVMSSEPDVNPAPAEIDPFMKVEVPPDLVMVVGKVPRPELGPGAKVIWYWSVPPNAIENPIPSAF